MENITIVAGLGYSVLGLAIVFLMLIALMVVIKIMGLFIKTDKKEAAPAPAAAPAAPVEAKKAPGSAGEVKLYDVSDKDAAMIMAIVADQTQKPLNELRFKSIKEVK